MKTKNLKSLSLNKTSISTFEVTGGRGIPTTTESNVTCGGICKDSAIVCEEK